MLTAKIFTNGRSQAVRLPKECRFKEKEVMVNKIGDVLVIIPKNNKWNSLIQSIDLFSPDYLENGKPKQLDQKRDNL